MTDARARIEAQVLATIERYELLPESGHIIVAVSGGADSVCLLGCLAALCGPGHTWPNIELVVAHLDHGLRGAAAQADAQWVGELAASLGLPCVLGARDVAARGAREWRGLEDAARQERYAFLRAVARTYDARRICVGHTRDDQAETLILQWLRGGALSGLAGMRPLREDIARPLLELRRGQTHEYCALRGWSPRQDATNADRRYRRNRVRLDLVPALERFNPNLVNTLARNASLLAADDAFLEQAASAAWETVVYHCDPDRIEMDAALLAALHPAVRRRVLRRAVYALQGDLPALESRHIALLERLAAEPAGAVALPAGVRATLDAGMLVLRRAHAAPETAPRRVDAVHGVQLPIPGRAALPGSDWQVRALLLDPALGATPPGSEDLALPARLPARRLHPAAGTAADAGQAHLRAYLDADAAGSPLCVRSWRPGDRFRPLGMAGSKKVQDYFVDARVPRAERAHIPLVWGPTHLVWIAGHRLDDRVKVTPYTRRVLALRLEPADPAGTEEAGTHDRPAIDDHDT